MGYYHDTVPFAKNNFAKAAKSAASKCNIERHPLLETASRNYSTHEEWHASLWRTRRSARQLFAQLRSLVAVTRGPFFESVSIWLARLRLARHNPKTFNPILTPTPPCAAATPRASHPLPRASPPACSESPSPPSAPAPPPPPSRSPPPPPS